MDDEKEVKLCRKETRFDIGVGIAVKSEYRVYISKINMINAIIIIIGFSFAITIFIIVAYAPRTGKIFNKRRLSTSASTNKTANSKGLTYVIGDCDARIQVEAEDIETSILNLHAITKNNKLE